MTSKIMTHVVAGYPTVGDCIKLLKGMDELGVAAIEVQIPFSDPIADGETIMRANDAALYQGMTTVKSFGLIKKADLKTDVYIMSYYQKVIHYGINGFCAEAKRSGAKGFIVPDLPVDSPDFGRFIKTLKRYKLTTVPVVSPKMSGERLKKALAYSDNLVYLTSTKGITGKKFGTGKEVSEIAKYIKKIKPGVNLAIGFGVSSRSDLAQVLDIADTAVVGSAAIRKINTDGVAGGINFVADLLRG